MGIYKLEDIVAIYKNSTGVLCAKCMDRGEWYDEKVDTIITESDIQDEEYLYSCDSCGRGL